MHSLERLLTGEAEIRDGIARISFVIGIASGITAQFAFHLPFGVAAKISVGILAVAYFGQFWLKTRHRVILTKRKKAVDPLRRLVFASLPTIALVIFLNVVQIRDLQAAVLDRRLRKLTNSDRMDDKHLNSIRNVLQTAREAQLRLNKTEVKKAGTVIDQQLQRGSNEAAINAAASLNSYLFRFIPIPQPILTVIGRPQPGGRISKEDFPFIEMGTVAPVFGAYVNEPNVARSELLAKPFDPSEYPSRGPSYIIWRTSRATLDGHYLKRVVFQNMNIVYFGGPVLLINVYFLNCNFYLQGNENSKAFVEAFAQFSPDGISFQAS